ncbi:MAG TPA: ADP-forming succinate--CoA ligase subunit beta [Aggregatilineales bacterium]|nr:ADP-forming succinate--CoA ligase subunit beta [Aggregatilineales bacterium]
MNLHEYQSKSLFAQYDIPTPKGKVATSPQEVYDITKELGGPVVVKAQVLTGGRGKAGGVKLARNPDEARELAEQILGMSIKGLIVHKVLVDPGADIKQELYLGVTNDRSARKPLMMSSSSGGMDIEQVNRETPEKIAREYIDPLLGLRDFQARNIASTIRLPRELWKPFSDIARNLYHCFQALDATLCEINPLVITGSGTLIALDGKISVDDNSLFRHPNIAEMRDLQAEPSEETRAREAGLSYIKLDGNIGCMVNGAGLAMTTMDITSDIAHKLGIEGSGPANFLDIGGGAKADKVAVALRIILSDPKVKAVLLNIFGGITRCDEVARGILQALDEVKTDIPLIVRLAGTNAAEGRAIIDAANIPHMQSAATLVEAAEKAVMAARGEKA